MNCRPNRFQMPPFPPNGHGPQFNTMPRPMLGIPRDFSRPPPSMNPRFGPPPGCGTNANGNRFNSNTPKPPRNSMPMMQRPVGHSNNQQSSGAIGNVTPRFNNVSHNQTRLNLNVNMFSRPPPPIPNAPFTRTPPQNVCKPDSLFNHGQADKMSSNPSSEGFPFTSSSHQSSGPSGRGGPMQGRGRGRGSWSRGGRGNFSGHKVQKKQKVDKRDLPENNKFSCDTCDRGFKTEEKYQEHINGHIKCSHKDCQYVAAPKLVHLHITLQHRSGLAKKVWSMESEEDIKKWREERKRNFPTAENIAKKKEEMAQRIARGEVLHTKDFSSMHRGKGRRGQGRGRGRGRGHNNRGWRGRGGHSYTDFDEPKAEISENKSDSSSSDDDDEEAPEEIKTVRTKDQGQDVSEDEVMEVIAESVTEKQVNAESDTERREKESVLEYGSPNNASLGLLASYGFSSSDEDDEKLQEEPVSVSATSLLHPESQPSPAKQIKILPNPCVTSNPHSSSSVAGGLAQVNQTPSLPVLSSITSQTSKVCEVEANNANLDSLAPSPPLTLSPSVDQKADNKVPAFDNSVPAIENTNTTVAGVKVLANEEKTVSPKKWLTATNMEEANKLTGTSEEMVEEHASTSGNVTVMPPSTTGSETAGGDGQVESPKKLPQDSNHQASDHKNRKRKLNDGNNNSSQCKASKQQAGKQKPKGNLPTYTLLEKLLAPDIRRERNKILQCIHYIVKNKFFDAGSNSKHSSP